MLGTDVCQVFRARREVFGFDVDDFDIADWRETHQRLRNETPDLIVHCAGYTDVDGAETHEEKAFAVNATGTRNVALVCQKLHIPMVYISTDYVFDGSRNTPYHEHDVANPLNVYGKSKLAGEEHVKNLLTRFYIVRTAWLYGRNGENFVYKVLKQASQNSTQKLRVVDDQIGNPTYTTDLARALDILINSERFGIYHVTNNGFCSWYEFAKKILEQRGVQMSVVPVDSDSLHQKARRPRFSALENFSWQKAFGEPLRHWEDALKDFLRSIDL